MKLARYVGSGRIEIHDEPEPELPPGGLLVKTEASGLCSGELMDWYMDRKIPHVLGHEVAGRVIVSDDPRFPVGTRVAPHHHAACGNCDRCLLGLYVHCSQWKRTKLVPGGMAEVFAVAPENLSDTKLVEGLRPENAALMEPLACVVKSTHPIGDPTDAAVIGLGSMGLMHMALLREEDSAADALEPVGIEINPARREWAEAQGFKTEDPDTGRKFSSIVVCPGSQGALDLAFRIADAGARIILFAPMPPGQEVQLPWDTLYFKEISLVPSYSCGPNETLDAIKLLLQGKIKAEQVVSHFIGIDELPRAYEAMKKGEILKAMVMFE